MSKNLAKRAELEAKYKDVDEEQHDDLADDVIFEPSLTYEGRRVAIAIKDAVQVCWCCHEPVKTTDCVDAVMGEGAVVRLCDKPECRRLVGDENREREVQRRAGNIIQLSDLSEEEARDLTNEMAEKKKLYRGY